MRRSLPALGVLLVLVVLATGCGGGSGNSTGENAVAASPASAGEEGASSSPGEQFVSVETTEFAFTPDSFELAAGPVTFEVLNSGAAEHNFVIEDASGVELYKIPVIAPGETAGLEANLEPGSYRVVCTLPGHRAGGMDVPMTVR